ncbi:unnamed protein product [Haemonchus placei]|uniref:Protein kinase domain-containing protein n=1 Tax=Haemonchus placei TaxID=6290 RepID=A0A0N4WFB0_HAEPC|nr:unnamed protein product [Haemonchus placei]
MLAISGSSLSEALLLLSRPSDKICATVILDLLRNKDVNPWRIVTDVEIGDTVVIDGVKYKKKRILGTGGSGSVFEIIREDNGTSFALKETSLRQNAEIYRGEVERLQTLKNCPHIIDLIAHDIIANNTILRMVLELGDGDLESEVKKNKGTLDAATVRLYAYEIGKGIQEMHENFPAIIHLDIKLANVLIISGTLKLVDFGLSATLRKNEDHVIRDFMFGSNRPPEQIVPRKDGTYKLTKKVDIWGFGFIVYQMTYGRKPFSNYTNKNKCIQRDVEKRATIEQLFAHRYLSEMKCNTCGDDDGGLSTASPP